MNGYSCQKRTIWNDVVRRSIKYNRGAMSKILSDVLYTLFVLLFKTFFVSNDCQLLLQRQIPNDVARSFSTTPSSNDLCLNLNWFSIKNLEQGILQLFQCLYYFCLLEFISSLDFKSTINISHQWISKNNRCQGHDQRKFQLV